MDEEVKEHRSAYGVDFDWEKNIINLAFKNVYGNIQPKKEGYHDYYLATSRTGLVDLAAYISFVLLYYDHIIGKKNFDVFEEITERVKSIISNFQRDMNKIKNTDDNHEYDSSRTKEMYFGGEDKEDKEDGTDGSSDGEIQEGKVENAIRETNN